MGQARRYYDGLGDNGTALLFAGSLAAVLYRVRLKGEGLFICCIKFPEFNSV